MKVNTYIIGFAVILAFGCAGLAWWTYELNEQLQTAQVEVGKLETKLAGMRMEYSALQEQAADLQGVLTETSGDREKLATELNRVKQYAHQLETEKTEAEKAQEHLEKEMNDALAQQEVTISRLKGKLTVNIVDRIMFDSGKAELKEGGQALLKKIAGVLAGAADRQILVVGHTDNVPVTASRNLYATNWELSAARATAAVRFLVACGVPPENLGALGYGEHHPIAANSTPAGRAENRRIEVVILEDGVLKLGETGSRD